MVSLGSAGGSGYQIDVQVTPEALDAGKRALRQSSLRSSGVKDPLLDTGVQELDEQLESGIKRLALSWLLAGSDDKKAVIERYFKLSGSEDNDGYLLFSRVDTEKFESIARTHFRPGLHQNVSLELIRQHAAKHIADGTLMKGALLPFSLIDRTSEIIARKRIQTISIHSDALETTITLQLDRMPKLADFPLLELASRSKEFLFHLQTQLALEIDHVLPEQVCGTPAQDCPLKVSVEEGGYISVT